MSSALQTVIGFLRKGDRFLARSVNVLRAFCNIFRAALKFLQAVYTECFHPSNEEIEENEENTPVHLFIFTSQCRASERLPTQMSSPLQTTVDFFGNANRFLERSGNVYVAFCGIFRAILEFFEAIYKCFNPGEDEGNSPAVNELEV
ncbi:hypothetical protein VKT23_013849 [Stygiomarasmius scandens]|uniref:Uncharacterized protein n=1 Tax=Marasmiellus scandens TaxID=2682957 RepID=A0ABR1J210_9AGAR